MSQGNDNGGTRARAAAAAVGVVAGGLMLAGPAQAESGCVPNPPAGSSICFYFESPASNPTSVTNLQATIAGVNFFTYQIMGDEPGYGVSGVSALYSGQGGTNRVFCSGASSQNPFDFSNLNGCGTYPAGSKIWLRLYNDAQTQYWDTAKFTLGTAPSTGGGTGGTCV